jgi:hypothetical protein
MSPTLVVAVAGPVASTPRGPPSTSPTLVLAAAGPAVSTPQGARHQHLQLQWWSLPELPLAPPRGPTNDISSFRTSSSGTSRGPAVNVS